MIHDDLKHCEKCDKKLAKGEGEMCSLCFRILCPKCYGNKPPFPFCSVCEEEAREIEWKEQAKED